MRTGCTLIGLVLTIGCGRIAFDPLPGDGREPDATDALVPPTARKLVVGWQHACVLEPTGVLHCWGQNTNSQLGYVGADAHLPVTIAAGTVWTDVALGDKHTCALDDRGRAWCWGGNTNSELGLSPIGCGNLQLDQGELCDDGNTRNTDGCTSMCQAGDTTPDVDTPTLIPGGRQYRRIFAMRFTTCAIAIDGTLWCWGRNGATQLGVGLPNWDRGTPAQVTIVAPQVGSDTSWELAAVGEDHVCATQTNGSLWCWGSNVNGQLGQNGATMVVRERPSVVASASTWAALTSLSNASCAISTTGALSCWGLNDQGQLGLGDVLPRDVPTTVDLGPWTDVAAAGGHACAIRGDGSLACWGANTNGQLGIGTMISPQLTPANVGGVWRAVGSGSGYSCALDQADVPFCWGSGANGKLGNGTTMTTSSPIMVAPFPT